MLRTSAPAIVLLLLAASARAQIPTARVGDVTHLQGQGPNVLVGYGLVTGLDKTGDGGKYLPTMRALAAMMARFGETVESLQDVQAAKNVAIVSIEVVIPDHGVREGERLDVSVSAMAAKSLKGGRLLSTPLVYHDRNVKDLFGFAQGSITIEGEIETSGTVRGGARMDRDVLINVVADGRDLLATGFENPWIEGNATYVTLVLDDAHAGWSMAAAVAQAVDKELSTSAAVDRVALAMDSKNIVVLLPEHQRGDAASWIRDVQRTPLLMESNEARVTINRRTGTIVVTGDTRLSPVIVSQLGMTVTVVNPRPDGTVPVPAVEEHDFVALDVEEARLANVNDLLEALNQLKVPFKDRVAILEQIHRAGKLHARILYEG
ncbi:MAG: flagellar basal body P-ring protein FlgI [Phycisphaerales bacterium]|nr:MAG: flagellar basal body P-ring protein FlgI [Phycisphaerales bacterium]